MTLPAMMEINYTQYGMKLYEWAFAQKVPISGGMELTHRCNLRCVHCYVASDKYPKELDTQEWFRIIDEIADAGCFWFYITGGEPMIRPDFLDIYLHARKRGMTIAILSNATCISDKIADTLALYPPQVVEISMYGATQETFDRTGKVKHGYRRFIEGLEKLLVRQIPIKLKTVALKTNIEEVHRIRKFANSLGVGFRYDAVVNARLDNQQSPYTFGLTPAETVALELEDEDKKEMWQHYCKNHLGSAKNDNLYQCGAGRSTFNIDPYGRLSVCLLSRRPNYPVLEGSFLDGWSIGVQNEISKKRVNPDVKCNSCDHNALCGNCPGYADLRHGVQEAHSEELCDLADKRAEAFGLYDRGTTEKPTPIRL